MYAWEVGAVCGFTLKFFREKRREEKLGKVAGLLWLQSALVPFSKTSFFSVLLQLHLNRARWGKNTSGRTLFVFTAQMCLAPNQSWVVGEGIVHAFELC